MELYFLLTIMVLLVFGLHEWNRAKNFEQEISTLKKRNLTLNELNQDRFREILDITQDLDLASEQWEIYQDALLDSKRKTIKKR